MMNEAGARTALLDRHLEGIGSERLILPLTHRPADDPTREEIQEHGKMQPALPCSNERHVAAQTRLGACARKRL
jgi:hypothetical protein